MYCCVEYLWIFVLLFGTGQKFPLLVKLFDGKSDRDSDPSLFISYILLLCYLLWIQFENCIIPFDYYIFLIDHCFHLYIFIVIHNPPVIEQRGILLPLHSNKLLFLYLKVTIIPAVIGDVSVPRDLPFFIDQFVIKQLYCIKIIFRVFYENVLPLFLCPL